MSLNPETISELVDRLPTELTVMMVVISDAWGGLEQTALNDAKLLQASGIQVLLLARTDSPIFRHCREEAEGIFLVAHDMPLKKFMDFSLLRGIRQAIREHNVSIVHLHQGSLLQTVVPALWSFSKVSLVLSRHILNDHSKRDPYHVLIYRRVDYIMVLSQTMRHNLATTFPVKEKKLRIVNLGIDLKSFCPDSVDSALMRKEWQIPKEAFLVGVVGRLDPAKRQDLVVKALAQLKDKIPHLHLVVVGAESPGLNGSYVQSLEQTVRELDFGENVSIVGAETRIPEVMASLDLFVMPSKEEAFGLVALEAMAMGVPTLLSKAGSAAELARGGRAELFRPGDAFDLSRKIRNLYRNTKYRTKMAEKALSYVHSNFSVEQRLFNTLDIYSRSIRRRRVAER